MEDCEGWPAVVAQWQSTCGVHIEHCEGWPAVVAQWQSTSCAVHIEDCEGRMVVVRLSWLSGRTLVAQARGVLGSTPSDCWSFYCSSVFAS